MGQSIDAGDLSAFVDSVKRQGFGVGPPILWLSIFPSRRRWRLSLCYLGVAWHSRYFRVWLSWQCEHHKHKTDNSHDCEQQKL